MMNFQTNYISVKAIIYYSQKWAIAFKEKVKEAQDEHEKLMSIIIDFKPDEESVYSWSGEQWSDEESEEVKNMRKSYESEYYSVLKKYSAIESIEELWGTPLHINYACKLKRCWLRAYWPEVKPVYFQVAPYTRKSIDELSDKVGLPPLVCDLIKEHFPLKKLRFTAFEYSDRLAIIKAQNMSRRRRENVCHEAEGTIMKYFSFNLSLRFKFENSENSYKCFQNQIEKNIFFKLMYLKRCQICPGFQITKRCLRDRSNGQMLENYWSFVLTEECFSGPQERFDRWIYNLKEFGL